MSNLTAHASGGRMPATRRARRDTDRGTLAYGLIAVCISLALVAVLHGIGSRLNSPFTQVLELRD